MSQPDKPHPIKINNSFDNEDLVCQIRIGTGNRMDAFIDGSKELGHGETKEVINLHQKKDVFFYFQFNLQPTRGGNSRVDGGIKIINGEHFSPHHTEFRRLKGNAFEIEYYFKEIDQIKKSNKTHIDAQVEHPFGEG